MKDTVSFDAPVYDQPGSSSEVDQKRNMSW